MHLKLAAPLLTGLILATTAAPRASGATIVVDSSADLVADDGLCTLREAILAANLNQATGSKPGECVAGDTSPPTGGAPDMIDFAIPGSGPFAISPKTPLPAVTEAAFIDGYSQPGASPNKQRSGNDAVLMLELRGDSMSADCDVSGGSPAQGGAFQFVGLAASGAGCGASRSVASTRPIRPQS